MLRMRSRCASPPPSHRHHQDDRADADNHTGQAKKRPQFVRRQDLAGEQRIAERCTKWFRSPGLAGGASVATASFGLGVARLGDRFILGDTTVLQYNEPAGVFGHGAVRA